MLINFHVVNQFACSKLHEEEGSVEILRNERRRCHLLNLFYSFIIQYEYNMNTCTFKNNLNLNFSCKILQTFMKHVHYTNDTLPYT